MGILVENCPRCRSVKITFDVLAQIYIHTKYDWQRWYEIFCVCRHCKRATTFVAGQQDIAHRELFNRENFLVSYDGGINKIVRITGFISLKNMSVEQPPEHLPEEIEAAFLEAATCIAVECWNAAGAMFRMCIDLATKPMLPSEQVESLSAKTRRDLGLRLPWLFDNKLLPEGLRDLSTAVREDGNDGAHAGNLKKEDAQDLLDFTRALLERLYTEPQKLALAQKRRIERRNKPSESQET